MYMMRTVTAKQLKQNTGAIIKMVRAGEKLMLTYRGKPVAIIQPAGESSIKTRTLDSDEAWMDIEAALAKSEPQFKNWKEATTWIRNRN